MKQAAVPLWGSKTKNEVVAPKWTKQIFWTCSGVSSKVCHLGAEHQHQNGIFPEHFCNAPGRQLQLDGILPEHQPLCGEHLNGKVQNMFGCGSFFGVRMALGHT